MVRRGATARKAAAIVSRAARVAGRLPILAMAMAISATLAHAGERHWIKQRAGTPEFVFSVEYDGAAENEGSSGTALAIRIISRRTGKTVQQIPLSDADPVDAPEDSRVAMVDANFDGHPDIAFYAIDGGAGPNDTRYFYLFDPRTGRFRLDDKLSSMTQVDVDPKRRVITSASRNGCCDHSSQTYRYIDGRLTLVESWQEALRGDDVVTTTGRLVRGRMRYSETKTPVPTDGK